MEIILRTRQKRVKQAIERDFQWYDSHSKQMLYGRGGEMKFRYDGTRTVPYITDHEEWVLGNDYDDILNWVKKNQGRVTVLGSQKDFYVLVNVHSSESEDVTRDLYRNNIIFED